MDVFSLVDDLKDLPLTTDRSTSSVNTMQREPSVPSVTPVLVGSGPSGRATDELHSVHYCHHATGPH